MLPYYYSSNLKEIQKTYIELERVIIRFKKMMLPNFKKIVKNI